MSLLSAAGDVARAVGPAEGLRILHVTDVHNRIRGFRFAGALARALRPALVVDTGDAAGIGGPVEGALLLLLSRVGFPRVFAPGNHDSPDTAAAMRRLGAEVLDRPRLAAAGGVRVWGYPDPNRSPLFGPAYDPGRCRAAARRVRPPDRTGGPYVVAVHNELMVEEVPPDVPLVLSGHGHRPRVRRCGTTLFVRTGSTGGGGPLGGPLHAAVIDVAPSTFRPTGLWLLNLSGRKVTVEQAFPSPTAGEG